MSTRLVFLPGRHGLGRSALRSLGFSANVKSSITTPIFSPRTSCSPFCGIRQNTSSSSQAEAVQKTEHHGSCHCTAVKVTLKTAKSTAELGARECQCSYCKVHGGSHTSDPEGELLVKAAPGAINRYRFGTGTADFLLCSNCGVAPAITWRQEGAKLLGVVRVQALENRDEFLKHEKQMNVNAENWEDRVSRRSRSWTPTVLEELGGK
ncbi:MAG: hypothetical protein M1820_009380 [Bogoriella megaspora]|nr:MAG: hypothetical protein M1820_009380 [Bogoriella megaspora]